MREKNRCGCNCSTRVVFLQVLAGLLDLPPINLLGGLAGGPSLGVVPLNNNLLSGLQFLGGRPPLPQDPFSLD